MNQLVTFVVPCYNSGNTLAGVVEDITASMKTLGRYRHEIVLVNDCSTDDTLAVIKNLCNANDNVFGISFAKNFGQHAALMAGFRKSRGDIVVCLDDDGQTPASEVEKLLEGIASGRDVVYARYGHKKQSFFRNFGSRVNDLMATWLLGKPKNIVVNSYFAVRRYVIDEIINYENPYPYVIGLIFRTTNNVSNVDVHHLARAQGRSGYTFKKLFSLWLNGFTTFSVKPLRIATGTGILIAVAGFIFALVTVIQKLVDPTMQAGWTSMICAIMVIGGLMMLMLGLVGEYIGRMYISINNSPQYVIRDVMERDGEKR